MEKNSTWNSSNHLALFILVNDLRHRPQRTRADETVAAVEELTEAKQGGRFERGRAAGYRLRQLPQSSRKQRRTFRARPSSRIRKA